MRYATVCSGIGAPEAAFQNFGWEHVFCAEIEKFPCAVLKHHYPNTPNYGDITQFQQWPEHAIDLLVGGTPCQSFSVAGLRAGLADPRGNLALTFLAIVERYRPQWVVWENVPGVHSSWSDAEDGHATEASGEAESVVRSLALEAGIDPETIERLGGFEECEQTSDFDSFLAGLAELGYGIATRVYDAQYFRLAQRRERVFVVGCARGQWQRAAAVLFDSESMRGNPPPRRQKGQGTARSLAARTRGGGGLGTDAECDGAVIPIQEIGKRESGTPQNGVGHGADGDPMFTLQRTAVHVPETAYALQERDSKGSDSNTKDGHLIPLAFTQKDHGADAGEILPTLRGMGHDQSHANGGGQVAIAFQPRMTRTTGGQPSEELNHALSSSAGGGDSVPCVAFQSSQSGVREVEAHATLDSNNGSRRHNGVAQGYAVRRLTPRECERLQGFPDDYTAIPYRGKPAADGPRYKALGNSMAVPVLKYIGERIQLINSLTP